MVEGITVENLFATDVSGEAEGGRGKGKEVDEVPLCGRCAEEIQRERKSVGEEHLIPLALARMDRFDGGLSRRRWEAQRDAESVALSCPLQHEHAEDLQEPDRPLSPIYVDMHDPIGGSAFEGRPTKPIPRWMQYLPSARRDQDEPRPASILDTHFSRLGSDTASLDDGDALPPLPSHSIPVTPPPVPPHNVALARTAVATYMPVKMSRPFTFIAEEPAQRPSSARLPGLGKHVRFDGLPHIGAEKRPSESAEYLERYSVGRPVEVRSGTVAIPSGLEGRPKSAAPPLSRRAGVWPPPPPFQRNVPRDALNYGSVSQPARDESGSSARTMDYRAREGCEQYSASPGSSACGEEGGVRRARARPMGTTFQDQLKRVFGFN